MKSRIMTILLFLIVFLALLIASLFLWASGFPQEPVEMVDRIIKLDDPTPIESNPPSILTIVSYNIHYGVGRPDDYDKRSKRETVEETLDAIAGLIREQNADIALLQEVDFNSDRTYGIDQGKWIAQKSRLPYLAPVTTWFKRYLPWPSKTPYGKMHSGQVVLSKWPILKNSRLRLPKPEINPFFYNAFYLDRTFQHVKIDVAGTIIDVFNVHTEAFNVPNRKIHAEIISRKFKEWKGEWNILAGDFNAVPPEAKLKHAFPDEPDQDMRNDVSVEIIRKLNLKEIIPLDVYSTSPTSTFTFPADSPNRRLDYLYFSDNFKLVSGGVIGEAGISSDHLPVFAKLAWQ